MLVLAAAIALIVSLGDAEATHISDAQAQTLAEEGLDSALGETATAKQLKELSDVKVESVEYGLEKDIVLTCSYTTVDAYSVLSEQKDALLSLNTVEPNGMQMTGTAIRLKLDGTVAELLKTAKPLSGTVTLTLYEVDGTPSLWLSDDTVDACFGGVIRAQNMIADLKTITVDGQTVSVESRTNLRNGLIQCLSVASGADRAKPDTAVPLIRWWNGVKAEFRTNFGNGYWQYITGGLWNTLKITFFALMIGIVLGFLVAIIRCTYDKIGSPMILNALCKLYLTVVRGTPVMVQLLIIYFVLLLPIGVDKVVASVICFGINSGAYVAEIVRGGIMGIDEGQMEAGRSLGFGYVRTMWYIIIPQAFKSVLPALANEFIALLKETSVASYIGVADLTRGGEIIRGITFSNFMPLLAVALIYLVLVVVLTKLVGILERRLHKGDRGS